MFLLKSKDHYDIKITNYSSTFMFKNWILLMKNKTKSVYESNTEIFEVLGIVTGIIGGLIPYEFCLQFLIIRCKWLPLLSHCYQMLSTIILKDYFASMSSANFNAYRLVSRMDI